MNKGRWKEEFDASYAVPEVISNNIEDVSWHNNASPSFSNNGDETTLWSEHPEPDQREWPLEPAARFYITNKDTEIIWSGNDPEEAVKQYLKLELWFII